MRTSSLGRSGYRVTPVGLGAWAFGSKSYGPVEKKDALAALEAYVEGGGNFIDTARGYQTSESIIGEFLRAHGCREQVVISSKCGAIEPAELVEGVETSMSTMGIDVIDIYHLHAPPEDVGMMNRCFDTLDGLREQGKIVATAASIKGPSVTTETQAMCLQYIMSGRCDVIQLIFSILRQSNRQIFDIARAHGVGLIGRTALESGMLSGHYSPGHVFAEGDHRRRWSREQQDHIFALSSEIAKHAVKGPYQTPAQIAIRYALDHPALSTVIVGARNTAQVNANLEIESLPPLSADVLNLFTRQYNGIDATANPV